ncbi:hypothetical protein pb186bvf_003183 [Paramecium bursaria]
MNQNFRGCLYQDHQYNQVQYYCTYPQCQLSKLLCSECFEEQIHQHNLPNNNHILNKRKFIQHIDKTIKQLEVQQTKKVFADVEQIVCGIKKQLEQLINIIKMHKKQQYDQEQKLLILQSYTIENCLNNLVDNIFELPNSIENQELVRPVNQIHQLSFQLTNLVKLIDIPTILETQLIQEQDNNNLIIACQLSNDCKYLVYGGINQQLNIWDIQLKHLIREIQQEQQINICRFTDDSCQLFVGQGQGYLSQYNLKNNFEQVYSSKIDDSGILNLIIINQYIYATTSDKTFIKMDINTKDFIFKIQAHQQRIDGICYDQQEKTIFTCSADLSIKIWHQNGILLIDQRNAHSDSINQIQIFNKLFISLDNNNKLYFWQINYQAKTITKINELFDNNGIYNFAIILPKQILTVSKHVVNIYDISTLALIQQYQHDINELFMFKTIQLHSFKAIVVKGKKSIKIFNPMPEKF